MGGIPEVYTQSYYGRFGDSSRRSAEVLVPRIMKLVAPTSVIDLGCGLGGWLAAFRSAGVRDIRGVDGDWVRPEQLAIPAEAFVRHDLATQPYVADRTFDLAMSIEAAEHLPAEVAPSFVQALTNLAPVVLFSAAVPGQSGEHHVNCQWPAYWSDLFTQFGYLVIDALRFEIWEDARVDWWYRQNIMLYVRSDQLSRRPELEALRRISPEKPLPLIHPEMFTELLRWGTKQKRKYWDLYLRREQENATSKENT